MGRKNSQHSQVSQTGSEEELSSEQKVQNKIKQLPNLKQKIQAIAINYHILQKRKLEEEMTKETTKIEIEFRKRYAPLLLEINSILQGSHEYSEADYQANKILTEEENGLKHNYFKKEKFEEYWFKALVSNAIVGEEIRQVDEPLIKYLIKVEAFKESQNSLKIIFTFAENQWFTNTVLTKQFELEGEEIKRSFGDQVNWKEGKNITVKTIKKKGKNKKKTIQKEVQSFFNFFKQIDLTEDDEQNKDEPEQAEADDDDSEIEKLQKQYEIANEFYESLVPRSLEFFLGVVGADFGDFAGLEDIDEEGLDEQEEKPKKKKNKSNGKRKGSAASSGGDQ